MNRKISVAFCFTFSVNHSLLSYESTERGRNIHRQQFNNFISNFRKTVIKKSDQCISKAIGHEWKTTRENVIQVVDLMLYWMTFLLDMLWLFQNISLSELIGTRDEKNVNVIWFKCTKVKLTHHPDCNFAHSTLQKMDVLIDLFEVYIIQWYLQSIHVKSIHGKDHFPLFGVMHSAYGSGFYCILNNIHTNRTWPIVFWP